MILHLKHSLHFKNPNSHCLRTNKPSRPDQTISQLHYKGAKPSQHSPLQGISYGKEIEGQPFLRTWALAGCAKTAEFLVSAFKQGFNSKHGDGMTEEYSSNNFVVQTQMISSLGIYAVSPQSQKRNCTAILSTFYRQGWIEQNMIWSGQDLAQHQMQMQKSVQGQLAEGPAETLSQQPLCTLKRRWKPVPLKKHFSKALMSFTASRIG